ncbi:Transcription factor FAMA [Acorus calamus]|uniref:Transcription factor FAMA n=1 Tax=Acorus calamus TaxID=4465 RepID=A0AAV9EXV8_ACOCL|nr:Transcription factor FAMA [Acorus calamus]
MSTTFQQQDYSLDSNQNAFMTEPSSFVGLDYSLDHHQDQLLRPRASSLSDHNNNNSNNNIEMVDYMLMMNNSHEPHPRPPQMMMPSNIGPSSFDNLSFADVMQFADFGPKLALNHQSNLHEEEDVDPVYFLKFPVLNDKPQEEVVVPHTGLDQGGGDDHIRFGGATMETMISEGEERASSMQLQAAKMTTTTRRKRARSLKTSEEVESQRMTHITVERNRRKQMNEHLRVLRSLMPGSYVQRGDQASIIGGAIEFVRELEQLLQCLESQKRRRIFGTAEGSLPLQGYPPPPSLPLAMQQQQQQQQNVFPSPPPFPTDHLDYHASGGLCEETAENKSCLADIEVKLLGFDALIKILSQRRPGQLLKTIAALEDLQLSILHTNITTIEQTVLYSFNVKVIVTSSFILHEIMYYVR